MTTRHSLGRQGLEPDLNMRHTKHESTGKGMRGWNSKLVYQLVFLTFHLQAETTKSHGLMCTVKVPSAIFCLPYRALPDEASWTHCPCSYWTRMRTLRGHCTWRQGLWGVTSPLSLPTCSPVPAALSRCLWSSEHVVAVWTRLGRWAWRCCHWLLRHWAAEVE